MKKLLMLLMLAGAVSGVGAQEAAQSKPIVLQTVTGKELHIIGIENGLKVTEYKGKITFLEFWGTHCPPCRISIPHYIDLMNQYKGKLAMLSIEVQDTPKERLKSYAQSKGINYDVVAYRDAGYFVDYIARRAAWKGQIPFLIILDPDGNVVTMQVGLLPQEALERVINDLLKPKAASTASSASSRTKKTANKAPAAAH